MEDINVAAEALLISGAVLWLQRNLPTFNNDHQNNKASKFCHWFTDILLAVLLLLFVLKSLFDKATLSWIMISVYYLYYFTMELFAGQTIGKMITRTKMIPSDAQKPGIFNIVLRTFLRMIPIDFISYFFNANGIHDNFSNTKLLKL